MHHEVCLELLPTLEDKQVHDLRAQRRGAIPAVRSQFLGSLSFATHPRVLDVLELQELLLDNSPQLAEGHDLLGLVDAMDKRQAAADLRSWDVHGCREAEGSNFMNLMMFFERLTSW